MKNSKVNFMKRKTRQIITYIKGISIYGKNIEKLPCNKNLRRRAISLRKAGVFSEVIFWREVHKKMFWNLDFDRQRIIGNYIVDFYIKKLGLIIEIDGSSHDGREEYDHKRDIYLMSLGLVVYRISDWRVKHDLGNVIKELETFIIGEYG